MEIFEEDYESFPCLMRFVSRGEVLGLKDSCLSQFAVSLPCVYGIECEFSATAPAPCLFVFCHASYQDGQGL